MERDDYGCDDNFTSGDGYDLIPGDNDYPLDPEGPPAAPGAAPNLTRIPAQPGVIPINNPVSG